MSVIAFYCLSLETKITLKIALLIRLEILKKEYINWLKNLDFNEHFAIKLNDKIVGALSIDKNCTWGLFFNKDLNF